MWNLNRRVVITALAAATLSTSAQAQDVYPNKPIRIIVATAPGGATDLTARLIGQKLSASMGQPVVVDNKPGANSITAPRPWPRPHPMATPY